MDGYRSGVSRVLVAVALVVIAILVLAACGGSEETAAPSPSPTPITLGGTTLPVPAVSGTIAFGITMGPDASDIYVINADGTGLKQLTDSPGFEAHPMWSPDGTRILYSGGVGFAEDRGDQRVCVMNADGSGKVELTRGTSAHWSPNGEQIIFQRNSADDKEHEICVMNADGSDVRSVVSTERGCDSNDPSWLSNERIIYVDGSPAAEGRGLDLVAVNLDGSDRLRLTKWVYVYDSAASPDGKVVAYFQHEGDCIKVVPSQGGAADVLFNPVSDYTKSAVTVAWTPDGKALAMATLGNGYGSPIFVFNADGSGLSAVPGVEWALDPSWRPQ